MNQHFVINSQGIIFCSELVVIFLKFLLDKDPIKQLLETDQIFEWDM
jgi:hypothetical protein